MTDTADQLRRLRIKASMIRMCEPIAWGSDADALEDAADTIERLVRERDEARTKVANLTTLLDQQMGTPCEQIRQQARAETAETRIAKLEAVLEAKLMPALLSPEQYMVADAFSEARCKFALELLIAVTAVLKEPT